jgi:excisionase family DNA binding protein
MSLDEVIESIFRRVTETTLRTVLREEIRQIVREELQTKAPTEQSGPPGREEFVTTKRAAQLVSVSEQSVRRWIASGELAAYRAGRLVRVRLDEVERYLARRVEGDGDDVEARARAILAGGSAANGRRRGIDRER